MADRILMQTGKRQFLKASAASAAGFVVAGFSALARAAAVGETGILRPEMFGARGDGRTNDTAAFAAMAAHVNAQGGGQVVLRRRATYIVGQQNRLFRSGSAYAFEPRKVMEFSGCTRPLVIRGNGATLRCAPGLRYGTFDPATGERTDHPQPFYGSNEAATPYRWMILAEDCSGGVEISDIELDGNLVGLIIGGEYDGPGRQITATGIGLRNNRGRETIRRVRSHHHALDGLCIDGIDRSVGRDTMSLIADLRCEHNGRQGCSIVGGRGYAFHRCTFSHTGRAGITSPPAAGVDIEAEGGKRVSLLAFDTCIFANNAGVGMVAATGPSEEARFDRCTFVGTTSWAVWPNKPSFHFSGCTFVGASVNCYGDRERPEWATRFDDCDFRDDPALSPTGEVYGGAGTGMPIVALDGSPNVRFSNCRFTLTHAAALPWTTNVVIFENCMMTQRSRTLSYPRGTYFGRNVIKGHAALLYGIIRGELVLNGTRLPQGPVG